MSSVAVYVVENAQDAEEKVDEIEIERDGAHNVLVGAQTLGNDVGVVHCGQHGICQFKLIMREALRH